MEQKIRALTVLLFFLHPPGAVSLKNNSSFTVPKEFQGNRHFLVELGAWQSLVFLEAFGIISNSFIVYSFYTDRNVLTSVNSMILMETTYRLGYNFLTLWRTNNMVMKDHMLSLWLNREEVFNSKLKCLILLNQFPLVAVNCMQTKV